MISVIDEVLNTGATEDKVKYKITFEDGTIKTATIELATPVTTEGTPLNKLLFDSIEADLEHLTPVTGTYTGTGSKVNTVFSNLGYTPKYIYITGASISGLSTSADFGIINTSSDLSQWTLIEQNASHDTKVSRKDSNGNGDTQLVLTVTENGISFGVGDSSQIVSWYRPLNANGTVYSYILLK